jgi:integrase
LSDRRFKEAKMAQKIKFSDTAIKNLPLSDGKRVYYQDLGQPGLFLRVGKADKVFCLIKRLKGGPVRELTIGPFPILSAYEARDRALKLLKDIQEGIDPKAKKEAGKSRSMTFLEATKKYLEHRRSGEKPVKPSTGQKFYLEPFQKHLAEWLQRPILEISRNDVLEAYNRITSKNTKATTSANILFRAVKAVFSFTYERLEIKDPNPVLVLKKENVLVKQKPKNRILFEYEINILYKALIKKIKETPEDTVAADLVLFILLTGCRRSEATTLAWKNVFLEQKYLTFEETKTGVSRSIPLSEAILEVLIRRKIQQVNAFVFPGSGKNGHIAEPRSFLDRLIKRENFKKHFCIHDLRRTFITYAKFTAESDPVDHLVGHTTQSVSRKNYQHPTPQMLLPTQQKISEKLLSYCQ